MDRVWVFSACLGISALWWGGIGEQWWWSHRISRRLAAGVAFLVGASGWWPSRHGWALGGGVITLAGLAILIRDRSARGMLAWVGCGALWWMIQARPNPVWGSGSGFWLTAAGVGLAGKLLAADPVAALAAVSGAGTLAAWVRWLWLGGQAATLGRSALALIAASGIIAWAMMALGSRATRKRRYRRRQLS